MSQNRLCWTVIYISVSNSKVQIWYIIIIILCFLFSAVCQMPCLKSYKRYLYDHRFRLCRIALKEGYQEVFKNVLLHSNKHYVMRIIAFLHLFLYPYTQLLACSSYCGWSLMEQTWLTLGPYLVARHEI